MTGMTVDRLREIADSGQVALDGEGGPVALHPPDWRLDPEELRAAIATLATKDELRQAVQQEGERSRRYMDVLTESLREDIHLIAAHVASAEPKRPEP